MSKKVEIEKSVMTFKEAVEGTSDISRGYCQGLKALKTADKDAVKVKDRTKLDGSVDIDKNTESLYPDANRWDYAIGYDSKAYFVEVHPANSSNVKEMEKKKSWLLKWMKDKAPLLNDYPACSPRLFWAATAAGVHILKGSAEYRKASQMNLIPKHPVVIG